MNQQTLTDEFDYIVSHFDGNQNDPDDIAAIPIAAALTNAAGLEDKSTFFYNNFLGEKPDNENQISLMRQSAAFAEQLGIETSDYEADIEATTDELVAILNSGEKVLAIEGGPMETIYRGLERTNPENLSNITLISHSNFNEDNDSSTRDGIENGRTWADIEQEFPEVELIGHEVVTDQNKGSNNNTGFWSGKWRWLDNTDNPVLAEARSLMKNAGFKQSSKINDASDAGMHFFAITGNKSGDPDDVKAFFDNNPVGDSDEPVVPPSPTSDNLFIGLYDASNNTLIETIENGEEITVNSTQNLTISVTVPENSSLFRQVESISLNLNDGQVIRRENIAPYALFGDLKGDLNGGNISAGDNTIALKAYSEDGLKGTLLKTVSREFTIVKDTEPPEPSELPEPDILISSENANARGDVLGTAGDNVMQADANSSGLRGLGRDGNDTLIGANNVDLSGEKGNDLLVLNGGDSFIRGGSGSDTFKITSETESGSNILDFEKGIDTIVFEDVQGVSSMSDLTITPLNRSYTADSIISFGDEQIRVKDVMVEEFSNGDFEFS